MHGDTGKNDAFAVFFGGQGGKRQRKEDTTDGSGKGGYGDSHRTGQKQDAESGACACTGGCADNIGGSEGVAENGLIDKAGNAEDKAADCADDGTACAQGEKNPPLHRVPG